MNELYTQFLELANAVWRKRWMALLVAWIICIAGWAFVTSKPNFYTSTARLYVDTESILSPLLKGLAVEENVKPEIEVLNRSLTSRSNLEKVARLTDLDITATTPAQMQYLLDSIKSRTTLESQGLSVISISYTDRDPVRARDVTAALTDIFIEMNLGENREEFDDAQLFLDRQIEQYEKALGAAEQRLANFKEEKLSMLPNQDNYQFRVEELRAQVDEAAGSLRRARINRDEIRRRLNQAPVSETSSRIFEAEQELSELLTRYTERHPDVIALRRKIEVLKGRNQASSDEGSAGDSLGGLSPIRAGSAGEADGGYSQLRLELGQAEADVAAYQDRVNRLTLQLERYEALVALIPETEVEFAKLNRDYDVLKIKHSELLSRREQARISRDRELGEERADYQIIEPPVVSALPIGPPRSLLIVAVFVFGLGAGIGFAILLSFTNSSFTEASALRDAFGIAVLGSVSKVHSYTQKGFQLARMSSFAGCVLLLFLSFGFMLYADGRQEVGGINPAKLGSDGYEALRSLVSDGT